MNKLLIILFGLIVTFLLTGCRIPSNQLATDGYYYKNVGGNSCVWYDVVTPGKIKCKDEDGNFTYYQNAMTDQQVMVWKLDNVAQQVRNNRYQNRPKRESFSQSYLKEFLKP